MNHRDPASLSLHPLHDQLPAPDFKSEAWAAFRENLHAAGPEAIPPVVITEDGQVMDGKRRYQAAQQLGWKTLRCEVRPAWQAALLLVESLIGQRDMTRGAKVYLARKLLPDYVRASEQRRLANLKVGRVTREVELKVPNAKEEAENEQITQCSPKESNFTSESIPRLCERFGITRQTWSRAGRVLGIFNAEPALKKLLEPQLLDGTKNLWNIISGTIGAAETKGKERNVVGTTQLEMFTDTLEPLARAVAPWGKIDAGHREKMLESWRGFARKVPAEARQEMAAILLEVES